MINRMRACAGTLALALVIAPQAAVAGSLSIAWDPNTENDLAGYLVHYGTQAGAYTATLDVGNRTMATIPNLTDGQRYYVAVQAYSTAGLKSTVSAEVSDVVAAPGITTALVAAYGFEEASGSIATDASSAGNGGTISGATRTASGRYGRALTFDGIDDVVTVADSPSLDLSTGMTIEAWVNPSALTTGRTVAMKEGSGGLAYGVYANDTASRPAGQLRKSGNTAIESAAGAAQLPLNTWSHVATTYDGANLRLYVNGTLVATRPVSGTIVATGNPLRIGGNQIFGEHFAGRIDELRIYGRALAATEITRNMGTAVVQSLVAAYGFEEASGTVASDISGNANHGTIQGATRVTTGRFGKALSFDGVNDVVTVADAASLDTSYVTVSAWVYPTALSGWRTTVIKEAPGGMVYSLYAHDNAPNPAMTIAMGGVDHATSGTAPLPLNTWTHLAATYDGTTVRLFINGQQVSTKAISGKLIVTGNPLRIGGNSVWGEYFSGRIDEVRVYNRALTTTEIQADMNRAVQ